MKRVRMMRLPSTCILLALCALMLAFAPAARAEVIASDPFVYEPGGFGSKTGGAGWHKSGWKVSAQPTQRVIAEGLTFETPDRPAIGAGGAIELRGTGQRNNPLRRQLASPYFGDELFVRFLLRYQGDTVDDGRQGDGEFVVLWLDDIDGGDGALHNPLVPNVGIRVNDDAKSKQADGENHFMVRVGSSKTRFTAQKLAGDTTYLIVARLAKTGSGFTAPFDRFELWINPDADDLEGPPHAAVRQRGSNAVRWIGFATGLKTEPDDRVVVDELLLGTSWEDVVPGIVPKPSKPMPEPAPEPQQLVDFRRDVYPILKARCFDCHQGRDSDSGHRLDVRDEVLGYTQGKALVVPGDSSASPFYQVLITDDESIRMPQGDDPLPKEEIAVLRGWIDQGMPWDQKLLPPDAPTTDLWSFQPIKRPNVPKLDNTDWIANPVDAFIARKHRESGLEPAPPAEPATLIRRIALDLTGLPPRQEDVQAFVDDPSQQRLQAYIDKLLSSLAYGERWGRHWLDVVRWAESNGYQHNRQRPFAWRYRDYVVRSFAENKPYDEFIRQQVAGDEMLPYRDENLIATGFLAAARYSGNELDKELQRGDILIDITNATASSLLGLTLECAQCHNHKFDPISARDYYRFLGFFVKGQPADISLRGDTDPTRPHQELADAVAEQRELFNTVRARMVRKKRAAGSPEPVLVITKSVIRGMSKDEKKRFDQLAKIISDQGTTWAYYSPVTSPTQLEAPLMLLRWPLDYYPQMLAEAEPRLLIRGDIKNPGPTVDVGWPAIFGPVGPKDDVAQRPRTALASWLTQDNNPLTARVWVNRIWQYHFGRGLVSTSNNFGEQGALPSHPELLDWLAVELIDSGWNTNHIHHLILTSNTYRQSAEFSTASANLDPENTLLWRWLPRRLEAEAIRDSILSVAGKLDPQVGGPSVPVAERDRSLRRSLYLVQRRKELPEMQNLFDGPSTLSSCGERRVSTVPLQPLFLLNNPQVFDHAQAAAERVAKEAGSDPTRQVDVAFRRILGRLPTPNERQQALDFLKTDAEPKRPALAQLCHTLINSNEFLYLE